MLQAPWAGNSPLFPWSPEVLGYHIKIIRNIYLSLSLRQGKEFKELP
jgi:hypothetical protein